QHEEGVTTIPRDSNTVRGDPLPSRLADRMPNITNRSTASSTTAAAGGNASTTPPGASRAGSEGAAATPSSGLSSGAASFAGAVGRMVPGVAEGEAVLAGAAISASASPATAGLVTPLLTAAEALPVAAGAGVIGDGAGHLVRAGALAAGATET